MRETCARVLAAALMTGAIAVVVWMSALAGTPNEKTRRLALPAVPPAPAVTIRVRPVQPRPKLVRQHVAAPRPATRVTGAPSVFTTQPLAAAHPRGAKRPTRHLAATKPEQPKRAPAPARTPSLPEPRPPVEPLDDHGKRNAYGHDKGRGKGHEKHEE